MSAYLQCYSIIKVNGKDLVKFLNGLATNLIMENNTDETQATYSCLLTPNGRFMFDFTFVQAGESFIVASSNFAEEIVKYLTMYKMSLDVSLEMTDNMLLHSPQKLAGFFQDIRTPLLGCYKISPSDNATVDCSVEYHSNRIKLKIADGFYDLTQKESIILDYGFDEMNAISYTKGCYLGQELISRTKHTGVIRKKVYCFTSQCDFAKGEDILQNREKVGKVLGHVGSDYLALINFEKADFSKAFQINEIVVDIQL